METNIDRRILKSQKAIQNAFLEMLLKDGFDMITIKELTEKADISRKTFYLHYVDKYDLLNVVVNKHLEEQGFVEGTVIWFRYFEERKAFFAALFATESTVAFRNRLLDFIMNQLNNKLEESSGKRNTEVLLKFMGMAVLGVVESFVLDQFHGGVEEIAAQVGELLEQIITSPQ